MDDSDRTCKSCDYTCRECSGPSNGECIFCYTNWFLKRDESATYDIGTCHSPCPALYYGMINRCLACDSSCYRCTGPSDHECTECPTNHYLLNA